MTKEVYSPALGDKVICPEDRGDPEHQAEVVLPGDTVGININGEPYIWVVVKRSDGRESVWPSNRLRPA